MAKRRTQTWLVLIVLAVGLVPAAMLVLFVYVRATATVLHPDVQKAPSVARTEPVPRWAGAVDQGRQIVRAGLSEQNLPGLSVAVGVNGDLEEVTLAGEHTRVVGHDGDSLGGMVASLMTFRERGLVVAVTSNSSYADTFGLAVRIAQAFAEPAR